METINWPQIENATTHNEPYPHMLIEETLLSQENLTRDFPTFTFPGLVPPESIECGPSFAALLQELDSQRLRDIIGKKLDMNLSNNPTLMTVRGFSRQRDGRIHVDTPDKVATILLYLNDTWTHDAGKIRVLRSGDNIEDYDKELSPIMGNMFIFKVTDNCWHGHLPLAAKRRAIMVNYMASPEAYKKHHNKHKRSARFKKLRSAFARKN
jgi:SM-20-related protein